MKRVEYNECNKIERNNVNELAPFESEIMAEFGVQSREKDCN